VVQLYVQFPKSAVERPIKELKGFQRISLKPGETRTVQIPIKAESLAWWNEKKNGWDLEPGPVNVLVGASSADIRLRAAINIAP
jgi:beta-glucosidase